MKMNGTRRIREMLLSRLHAVYALQEKTRAAQKLPKCFHVSSVAKDIIETVWKAGGIIEVIQPFPFYCVFTLRHPLILVRYLINQLSLDLFHWSSWICSSCRTCEVSCLSICTILSLYTTPPSQEKVYSFLSCLCDMFMFGSWKNVALLLHDKYH